MYSNNCLLSPIVINWQALPMPDMSSDSVLSFSGFGKVGKVQTRRHRKGSDWCVLFGDLEKGVEMGKVAEQIWEQVRVNKRDVNSEKQNASFSLRLLHSLCTSRLLSLSPSGHFNCKSVCTHMHTCIHTTTRRRRGFGKETQPPLWCVCVCVCFWHDIMINNADR